MKTKRLLALITGIVLITILFFAYSEFNGNPFYKINAKHKIDEYLITHFTEVDYSKSNISYNFKDGTYYMDIDVKNSEDKDFTITYKKGNIDNDYEWRVEQRENTNSRLQIYLNEDRWEEIPQDIFGENYNFSLITVNEDVWKNNLPSVDMSIEDMLKKYPLEIKIYLHEDNDIKEARYEELKKQVYEAYYNKNMKLSKITIEG